MKDKVLKSKNFGTIWLFESYSYISDINKIAPLIMIILQFLYKISNFNPKLTLVTATLDIDIIDL